MNKEICVGDLVFPNIIPYVINDYYGYMFGNTPKDKYRIGKVISINNEDKVIRVDNDDHVWDYHPKSLIPVKVINVIREEGMELGGKIKSQSIKLPYIYSLEIDGLLYKNGGQIGDIIHGINGTKTFGLEHSEVINLLMNSSSIVLSK